MLGEKPPQRAAANVLAVMLWPAHADAARREQALSDWQAEFARRELDRRMPEVRALFGPEVALPLDLVATLLSASGAPSMAEETRTRAPRGLLVGRLVLDMLKGVALGQPRSMSGAMADLAKQLKAHPSYKVSASTFANNLWPSYRDVACLYAASLLAGGPFPCRLAALGDFLAVADALRKIGETVALRDGGKLIRQNAHWRIPPTIKLPKAPEIDWRSL